MISKLYTIISNKFAYHFPIKYDLNLKTAEFLEVGLCDGETLFSSSVTERFLPKICRQQQIFDLDLKGAWHYKHVTFTPIAKNFMLYCTLIYMLSVLCVRLTIKVKVEIPESFKVGWYPPKKTGSSHLQAILLVVLK